MVYRPQSFALKGREIREIQSLIKPGDILVRTFNQYLNNYFLPSTFKHVGLYLGEVSENHLRQVAKISNPNDFNPGKQRVIHAIGDEVILDDLLDFCRCDGLAIMRFPRVLKNNKQQIPDILKAYFKNPTPPISPVSTPELAIETDGNENFFKRLLSNTKKYTRKKANTEEIESEQSEEKSVIDPSLLKLVKLERDIALYIAKRKEVEFNKVFKILYNVALKELNTPHDYNFGIEPYHLTRSTELIYFITKSLCWNYYIEAESVRIFFKEHLIITPDIFVDSGLEEIWKSDI